MAGLEILQGTLDLLVLRTLSSGAMHGYAIVRWLRETSAGDFVVEDRALYVALHRLEERGLVEAEWGLSENNRRARYYRLTPAGRKRLGTEAAHWARYAAAVARVLGTAGEEATA